MIVGARPTISYLVAVRNRPDQVLEAIASVAPTDDAEVVVVDDASTDHTLERLEDARRERPDLRIVGLTTRHGAGAARNAGAREATGEWCFILDSDNRLRPDGRDGIDAALARHGSETDVFFLGSQTEDGTPTGDKSVADGPVDAVDVLAGTVRGEYCVLVRREALLRHPYNETPGRDNALATWLQIGRQSGICAIDRPVLLYDDRGDDRLSSRHQTLRDPEEAAWCHRQLIELFGNELLARSPAAWAERQARAAFMDVLAGERRRAARTVAASVRAARVRSQLPALAAVILGRTITRRIYARGL